VPCASEEIPFYELPTLAMPKAHPDYDPYAKLEEAAEKSL
jgi:hypothetical protein